MRVQVRARRHISPRPCYDFHERLVELAKGRQMPRFDRILCPVDFDQNSLLALRTATELAQERGATLYLLHVIAVPPGPEVALPFGTMETAARTRLEKLARQKIGGKAGYEVDILMGDPGVEVVQLAKRLRADLIVMATHGRKGLRHIVLGSVAERVVREAPCPVLTVKPKPPAAKSSRRRLFARKRSS
jgi:nucleotide-binding universal stress UspA family protein